MAEIYQFVYISNLSISFLVEHYLIATFILIVSRFVFKTLYFELANRSISKKRVLIYGVGKLGLSTYQVVIAIAQLNKDKKKEIIDACLQLDIQVKSIPPAEQWINGELTAGQIKDVNIEDLLGRDSIQLGQEQLKQELRGKVVLITGGAGSIGHEIVMQALYCDCKMIVVVDQSETGLFELEHDVNSEMRSKAGKTKFVTCVADVSNQQSMQWIFDVYKPKIVYHAAAYKHVPLMECNPHEAIRTNVQGTKVLADLALIHQVEKFVMVSTDKAVNPTNVMGASKRLAEMYVQSLFLANQHQPRATKFITTRFGNVLGSNGSVIPLFKKQIAQGGPITVTHPDITRYFMTIPEACQLVMEAGAMGNGGEIFIFDMGESVKIIDLAKKMIKLSGYRPDIDIKITYTGLREGEKLYEELLNNKENTLPTHHDKIMIAQVREVNYNEYNKELTDLTQNNYYIDEWEIVKRMKRLVPEFKSNASKFQSLDQLED